MGNTRVYIDGLNLYHGMIDEDLGRFRWLDLVKFSRRVCAELGRKTDQLWDLTDVHYFTSPVHDVKGNQAWNRQRAFLQALERVNPDTLSVTLGKYYSRKLDCDCDCGSTAEVFREKRTDVLVALSMLEDALDEEGPERLIVVTGDADLVPAVELAQATERLVGVVAPPSRHSADLSHTSDAYLLLKRKHFSQKQLLPTSVKLETGYVLSPPDGWVPRSYLGDVEAAAS